VVAVCGSLGHVDFSLRPSLPRVGGARPARLQNLPAWISIVGVDRPRARLGPNVSYSLCEMKAQTAAAPLCRFIATLLSC
jgi:hypothetical protein